MEKLRSLERKNCERLENRFDIDIICCLLLRYYDRTTLRKTVKERNKLEVYFT